MDIHRYIDRYNSRTGPINIATGSASYSGIYIGTGAGSTGNITIGNTNPITINGASFTVSSPINMAISGSTGSSLPYSSLQLGFTTANLATITSYTCALEILHIYRKV